MRRALLMLALAAIVSPARGADFTIGGFAGRIPIIDVRGELLIGDEAKFALFSDALFSAIVRLDSPGGKVFPALNIGDAIARKGFGTYVSAGRTCASACALIWLAGTPRAKDPTAMLGFHSAYEQIDGRSETTGPGNAMIGAYLGRLRLDTGAIFFVTHASPNDMQWLTPQNGLEADIAFDSKDEVETTRWTNQPPRPPVAPVPVPPPPVQPVPVANNVPNVAVPVRTTVVPQGDYRQGPPPAQISDPEMVKLAPPPPPKPVPKPPEPPRHLEARVAPKPPQPRTLQDDVREFFLGDQ